MYNINNNAIARGCLTADPYIFNNSDGSRKICLTVAAQNAYRNKDGSWGAQFIPVEKFIPADKAQNGNGIYDRLHKGDKVTVQYTVVNNNYIDKATGQPVYALTLKINVIRLEYKAASSKTDKTPAKKSQTGTRRSTKSSGKKTAA